MGTHLVAAPTRCLPRHSRSPGSPQSASYAACASSTCCSTGPWMGSPGCAHCSKQCCRQPPQTPRWRSRANCVCTAWAPRVHRMDTMWALHGHRVCTVHVHCMCAACKLHMHARACTGTGGRARVRRAVPVGLSDAGQCRGRTPGLTDAQVDAPGTSPIRIALILPPSTVAQADPLAPQPPWAGATGGGTGQARGGGAARFHDAHAHLHHTHAHLHNTHAHLYHTHAHSASSAAHTHLYHAHTHSVDALIDAGGEHTRAGQGATSTSAAATTPPRSRTSCVGRARQPRQPCQPSSSSAAARGHWAGARAGARAGSLDAPWV